MPLHIPRLRSPLLPALRVGAITFSCLLASVVQAQQPVTVVQPQEAPLQARRSLSGSLISLQSSALSARLSGVVSALHVDVGQRVQRGDPILQLDAELAEHELRRRQAAVEEAEQRLAEAQRLSDERQRLAKQRNLAQTQAESAAAEARIAASVLARLQAELAQQQAVVRRHQLRAPFAGVVTERLVDVGEWVDPSSAVVELLDDAALRFEVQVPQEWWTTLGDAPAVALRFDPWPERRFAAVIEARVPRQDPSSRSFLVRLRLEQVDPALTVGMSGVAEFVDAAAAAVLTVPRDAVVRYPDGSAGVWTVQDRDGEPRVQPRSVRLGSGLADRVQVLEGLSAADWVVLRGNERLKAGEPVSIVESE